MKNDLRFALLAPGFLALLSLSPLHAQLSVAPPPQVRVEAARLILADAKLAFSSSSWAEADEESSSLMEFADDTVDLPTFVVREDRLPDFSPPKERVLEQFFRTGTLMENVGREVTTRLWMKGDKGVMLSFSR